MLYNFKVQFFLWFTKKHIRNKRGGKNEFGISENHYWAEKKRKLSQKQAAADLGISQALLSHYEKGIRECGLDFVVKIADYYNVSCDYLLGHASASESAVINDNDVDTVKEAAACMLTLCRKTGGENLEKEILDYIMLNFYKLFRIISRDSGNNKLFNIPQEPAENLADSVIMSICASIKLKSGRDTDITDEFKPDNSFEMLVRASERKISDLCGLPCNSL